MGVNSPKRSDNELHYFKSEKELTPQYSRFDLKSGIKEAYFED